MAPPVSGHRQSNPRHLGRIRIFGLTEKPFGLDRIESETLQVRIEPREAGRQNGVSWHHQVREDLPGYGLLVYREGQGLSDFGVIEGRLRHIEAQVGGTEAHRDLR